MCAERLLTEIYNILTQRCQLFYPATPRIVV